MFSVDREWLVAHDHGGDTEIDLFHRRRGQTGCPEKAGELELPVDAADACRDLPAKTRSRVGAMARSEVIQEHDAATATADAQHLANRSNRIGDDIQNICCVDCVE